MNSQSVTILAYERKMRRSVFERREQSKRIENQENAYVRNSSISRGAMANGYLVS